MTKLFVNMSIELVALGNEALASHSIPKLPTTEATDLSPEGNAISKSLLLQ